MREGWERHPWFAELYLELKAAADLAKERAASKKQRQGNVKFKNKGGARLREVKLDPKKHRNVSRRQVHFHTCYVSFRFGPPFWGHHNL